MGRVIKREVVAIRCELATPRRSTPACAAVESVWPVPAAAGWEEHVSELSALVARGWAFVLVPKLRAYCPEHADRAWDCTCLTHPERRHLCPSHGEVSHLVWTDDITPAIVARELSRIGAAA